LNIILKNVSYIYNPDTVNEKTAVSDINLEIGGSSFIALAGSTGSGKSTLVQMLNALKLPTRGTITYDGETAGTDKKKQREIRCRVGLVFQYPEYQLFDETLLKDVSFGPRNKGLSRDEAEQKAKKAILDVGLDEEMYLKSPFDLSGGEKRRAAIAGVLAMEPEVLILDEPTAGLDPVGKKQILELLKEYQRKNKACIIMISHNMDEIAEYADRVIVMSKGRIIMDGAASDIFVHENELKEAGLSLPQASELAKSLGIEGVITIEDAAREIFCKYNR